MAGSLQQKRAARVLARWRNPEMPWPFNHFRKPRLAPRGTIEAIYGMIVTQAREPLFYRYLGVADTVNGRFDLLILHLWMVLRRLRPMAGGEGLAQALFDRFCDDMDANLREMGVGDLTVPKRMQAFGEAFYGRAAAYDLALTEGLEPLAQALCKNILNGGQIDHARRLAAYALAAIAGLAAQDDSALLAASWTFPLPDSLAGAGGRAAMSVTS
jgi:cytochrome b pre-mRNA-processing protein 3